MNWAAWNASSSRLGGSGEGREKGEESDDKEEKGDRKRRLKDRLKFLENTLLSLILSQWGNIQDPWDDDNSTVKHFKLVCKVLHSKCNQFQQNLWSQSKITWQEVAVVKGLKWSHDKRLLVVKGLKWSTVKHSTIQLSQDLTPLNILCAPCTPSFAQLHIPPTPPQARKWSLDATGYVGWSEVARSLVYWFCVLTSTMKMQRMERLM